MKKALVIFNPMAGAKKLVDTRRVIEETLKKANYSYDFFETIKAERQPLDQFLGKSYDRVIVSGGDGTVAEVTSFLISNKVKAPLIIIPQGTANILAISLGLPLAPKAALNRGLKSEGRPLDAMRVNGKYYGTIATGCGYDTVIMADTSRDMKRKIGFMAYIWTMLKTLFIYRTSPYRISVDGERYTVLAKTIMTFNILPLGNLGVTKPFLGTPIAPDDGLLNIFVLNPRPIRDFFRFRKALRIMKGKEISISNKKERRYQIDGNVFKGKKVTIKVIPKAFYVCY